MGFIPWASAGKPIYTWGWAFGGSFYDQENNVLTVNQPQIIEAVQWEHDFASQFGLSDFVEFANGAISGSGATDPFVAGKVAMIIKGNWDIANIAAYNPDMNYTISYIPTKDESLVTTGPAAGATPFPAAPSILSKPSNSSSIWPARKTRPSWRRSAVRCPLSWTSTMRFFSGNPRYDVILQLIPYAQIRPSVPVASCCGTASTPSWTTCSMRKARPKTSSTPCTPASTRNSPTIDPCTRPAGEASPAGAG